MNGLGSLRNESQIITLLVSDISKNITRLEHSPCTWYLLIIGALLTGIHFIIELLIYNFSNEIVKVNTILTTLFKLLSIGQRVDK